MPGKLSQSVLLELLLGKYQTDRKGFRKYLPEVAQQLDALMPESRVHSSPFGLTPAERQSRMQKLSIALKDKALSKEGAIHALEHCAVLIDDDSLPRDIPRERLLRLVRIATGGNPSSVKKDSTFLVNGGLPTSAKRISLLRGIALHLSPDMHLVTISISPQKMQERRAMLRIVGIAEGGASDVAARHDDYLAETDPHGRS